MADSLIIRGGFERDRKERANGSKSIRVQALEYGTVEDPCSTHSYCTCTYIVQYCTALGGRRE